MRVVEATPGQLIVEIDLEVFRESAVFKWLYWCGERWSADVERVPETRRVRVAFSALRPVASSIDWETQAVDLRRSLIDFQTRQIVAEETKTVRELIVAKALDSLDPLPLPPPGEISDPVGFGPGSFDDPEGI